MSVVASNTSAESTSQAKPRLRRFQFSLRTALLLMLLASILFAGFAWRRNRAERQRKVVAELRELGADVEYKYFAFFERRDGNVVGPHDEFFVASYLRSRLGDDFVSDVRSIRYAPSAYVPPRPVPPLADQRRVVELVKQLPRLEMLSLHADVSPQDLAEFPFLETIEHFGFLPSRGTWEDADLVPLEKCCKLEYLSLPDQPIDGSGLAHLHNCKNLRYLLLYRTNVSDAALIHLTAMTSLEHLSLGGTKVTDAGIADAELPPKLESLDLSKTPIGEAAMENISQLRHLLVLHVEQTQVTRQRLEFYKARGPKK